MNRVTDNINRTVDTFSDLRLQLSTYDTDLIDVMKQHEQDFVHAYKLHMWKIGNELK